MHSCCNCVTYVLVSPSQQCRHVPAYIRLVNECHYDCCSPMVHGGDPCVVGWCEPQMGGIPEFAQHLHHLLLRSSFPPLLLISSAHLSMVAAWRVARWPILPSLFFALSVSFPRDCEVCAHCSDVNERNPVIQPQLACSAEVRRKGLFCGWWSHYSLPLQ